LDQETSSEADDVTSTISSWVAVDALRSAAMIQRALAAALPRAAFVASSAIKPEIAARKPGSAARRSPVGSLRAGS
jgi:hypothetical protein